MAHFNQQQTTITPWDNLADSDLKSFFRNWQWLNRPMRQTTIDFKKTNFLAPWAITLFATYTLWLKKTLHKNITIDINLNSSSGGYLIRTGFCDLLEVPYQQEQIDAHIADKTAKLKLISNSSEIYPAVQELMRLLEIGDTEIEGAIRYVLIELLRNVVQHSQSSIGGICMGQYYPNTGLVELVVADIGVGIQKTLHSKYPEIDNDLKAIKFAPQPHISGTFPKAAYSSMSENAGLGLFFIKEIVTRSGGGFFLGSGSALVNIWGTESADPYKEYTIADKNGWAGTFAVIQFKRNSILEFEAVLSTCRELAAKSRNLPEKYLIDFIEGIPAIPGLTIIPVAEFEEDVERASKIRDTTIFPALSERKIVVLDFTGIKFATQSFVHALIYKILRDNPEATTGLSIANCTTSTRESILTVAAYATTKPKS